MSDEQREEELRLQLYAEAYRTEMNKQVTSVTILGLRIRDLEAAIRLHRDQRGDDRCWQDDETLYQILPEGYTPPQRDTKVELENCQRYITCRQNPVTVYISPQRRIDELEARLKESKQSHYHCDDSWYCCALCVNPDHGELDGHGGEGERVAGVCNCGASNWNARLAEILKETI